MWSVDMPETPAEVNIEREGRGGEEDGKREHAFFQ
tara:strand:- start:362 stop:466 length:105 start_codon:yes stop_codon:yes gene_type:complete